MMINLLKNYYFTDYELMLINKAKKKINQVIEEKGIENIAVSFSGGIDSLVLKHLVESINSNIISIFCNTGVEYYKIVEFVKSFKDVKIVYPKFGFFKICEKYGWPVISKEQSRYLSDVKNPKVCQKIKNVRLGEGNFKISKKWRWLLKTDIKISDKCCYHLKKAPLQKLKKYYFTGERVQESNLRKQKYHTCILPNKCIPLRLWTNKLIWKYIYYYKLKVCDIYKYEKRTGCKFCMYGIHREKYPDRIDRLQILEPKSYKICKIKKLIDLKNLIKSSNKKCWN